MTLCRASGLSRFPPTAFKRIPNETPYLHALHLQHAYLTCQQSRDVPVNLVLLLQHPPTFTFGRRQRQSASSSPLNLMTNPPSINSASTPSFIQTDRGGLTTYHGPGQWTGYPLLNLPSLNLTLRCYVHYLEAMLIQTCEAFNLHAERQEGRTGVWVGPHKKIAAIGLQLLQRKWTMHGFGLNVKTDLSNFTQIVPCGLADCEMTSFERELKRRVEMDEVADQLERSWERQFLSEVVPLREMDNQLDQWVDEILKNQILKDKTLTEKTEKERKDENI